MEELELRFEDEAGIYLPQVVAEENRRKANEHERVTNEEERKVNEIDRVASEEYRKKTMQEIENQANSIIDEMNANLKKISFIKTYKLLYTTDVENETTFNLPAQYTETSMLDVRVNGFSLNETEYTVNLANLTVSLTKPVDLGTPVEVVVTRLTTAHVEDYSELKPAKGVDYWTTEDIEALETYCNNYIDSQFATVLDRINGEVV